MIFPIDHDTFIEIRNSRPPIRITLETEFDHTWKYWMTTEGEVFAILGRNQLIKFGDYPVDLVIDESQWVVELISKEKPKEIILNHLKRGTITVDNSRISQEEGLYRLYCPTIKKEYEVWIKTENLYFVNSSEVFIWWKEKMDLIKSIPLIYEMIRFYSEIIWKKS